MIFCAPYARRNSKGVIDMNKTKGLALLLTCALLFSLSAAFAAEGIKPLPDVSQPAPEAAELNAQLTPGKTTLQLEVSMDTPCALSLRVAPKDGDLSQTRFFKTELTRFSISKLQPGTEYVLRITPSGKPMPCFETEFRTLGSDEQLPDAVAGEEAAELHYTGPLPAHKSTEHPYLLLVSKAAQIVTVFEKDDDGAYTVPIYHAICSTGRTSSRTPVGFYTVKRHKMWVTWAEGEYSAYNLEFAGNLKFHSVLYTHKDFSELYGNMTARLGTPASAGCIRLTAKDAKWIYELVEDGTPIEIIQGEEMPELKEELLAAIR